MPASNQNPTRSTPGFTARGSTRTRVASSCNSLVDLQGTHWMALRCGYMDFTPVRAEAREAGNLGCTLLVRSQRGTVGQRTALC